MANDKSEILTELHVICIIQLYGHFGKKFLPEKNQFNEFPSGSFEIFIKAKSAQRQTRAILQWLVVLAVHLSGTMDALERFAKDPRSLLALECRLEQV